MRFHMSDVRHVQVEAHTPQERLSGKVVFGFKWFNCVLAPACTQCGVSIGGLVSIGRSGEVRLSRLGPIHLLRGPMVEHAILPNRP